MKTIGKKDKDVELVSSGKYPDRADILSANPREDTIKVRAKKNGKNTTKTLTIKIEKIKKQKKTIEEIEKPKKVKGGERTGKKESKRK